MIKFHLIFTKPTHLFSYFHYYSCHLQHIKNHIALSVVQSLRVMILNVKVLEQLPKETNMLWENSKNSCFCINILVKLSSKPRQKPVKIRNSLPEVFYNKEVPKKLANFEAKQLCQSLIF